MAELALGVLGVIPLLGAAYKSYRSVYSTLKAFRHCSHDLNGVCKRLKLSRAYFQHECCLLLRFALDEESINAMRADLDHANWSHPDLELRLQDNLVSGYEACGLLVESINRSLKQFEEEVARFEDLVNDRPEAEGRGGTIRRLKKRTQLAFNKSKYESICKELRDSNIDLTGLREQISELQYPTQSRKPVPNHRRRGNWGAVCRVRCVSMALHQGFRETWSCQDETHADHSVKMFLDFDMSKQSSDLAITVVGKEHRQGPGFHFTNLEVRSEKLDWINTSLPTPSPSPPSDEEGMHSSKRKKTVRFAQVLASPAQTSQTSQEPNMLERVGKRPQCNLRNSSDVCLDLSQRVPHTSLVQDRIGYLDVISDESFRHNFFATAGHLDGSAKIVPLNEILNLTNLEFITVQDRLKAARSVAIAALTYHSTPWLKEYWRLGDLHFLAKAKDPSSCFQSLHLDADLSHESIACSSVTGMDGVLASSNNTLAQSSEDERLFVGINNMTLHSLGVALLGIDKWQEFDPGDLAVVRRAARSSMFGPKYRDVVQRCLGCEFRYGHDLSKPKLHQAVYENVVGSLEDMIASLDIADDESTHST